MKSFVNFLQKKSAKALQISKFTYACFHSTKVLQSELKGYPLVNSLKLPILKEIRDISITPPSGLWNLNPTISANSNVYFRQTTGAFFPIAKLDGVPVLENESKKFGNAIYKGVITSELKLHSIVEVLPMESAPCLEDVRAIVALDKEYLVGTLVTSSAPNPWKSSVAIYDLAEKHTIVLKSPLNKIIEKNWVPIEVESNVMKILYLSNPLQFISVDLSTGLQINSIQVPQDKPSLNGGSQFVKLSNGCFLRVARKRFAVFGRGRVHLSYLLLHDRNYNEILRSRPFIFQTVGFEICNGIAQTELGEIRFTWGENDRKMFIGTAEIEEVLNWIETSNSGSFKRSLYRTFKLLR